MARLLIIAGSNGAGKTTFARPYVEAAGLPFLNADELTREFEDAGESQALIKAGRAFLQAVREAIEAQQDFAMETTLSGGYIFDVVRRAREVGYRIEVVYLFVDSPEVAVARVGQRVLKGGHDVPEEAIRRRYFRSKANFIRLRDIVDGWRLYHSANQAVELVAERKDGFVGIFDKQLHDGYLAQKPNHND